MALQTTEISDVVVVVPEGMLKGDTPTSELDAELLRQLDSGRKKLLLDLRHTTHLSSVAIGILASFHISATSRGVHFGVCNVERRIQSTLTIVRLVDVLNLYGSRDDAMETFQRL